MIRIAALATLVIALAAPSAGARAQDSELPRPVLVSTVRATDTASFGPFIGTVDARYRTSLGFQVSGRIISRLVNVGDRVKQGQHLASVDATLLRLSVQAAQADLATAGAQLSNAALTERRSRTLVASATASKAQLDAARAARETAEARVTQAQAALRQAQNVLGYAELIAPFEGVITAVNSDVGKVVAAGDPILSLARPDVLEAVVDVPDYMAGQLRQFGTFDVALAGVTGVRVSGTVRELAPASDPVTRTRRARLSLENPPRMFRLGSTITVSARRPVEAFVAIPRTALVEGDKPSVWIVDEGRGHVTGRAVSIVSQEDASAVVTGLRPGEIVVIAGVHSLREGQAVQLPSAQIPENQP